MSRLQLPAGAVQLTILWSTAVVLILGMGTYAMAAAAGSRDGPNDAPKEPAPMDILERNGRAYVSAGALGRSAGIAVKALPGQKFIVACSGERSARVTDFLEEGRDVLVEVNALAEALGMRAQLDAQRRHVDFKLLEAPGQAKAARPDATPGVGDVAPDFKLSKLDGTPVSLSDFRGKRVLINSWASW